MQPPKRQIIKTRPQRQYILARIVIVTLIVIALSFMAWALLKPHPGHALGAAPPIAMRQEATGAARRATARTPMDC